mmetsp:Transcript_7704/g.11449  ORF Transcript_7704/g.11449 Transcript_7704/m.11449 type:complete len:105 (-) Transcript_7704:531-845(-)
MRAQIFSSMPITDSRAQHSSIMSRARSENDESLAALKQMMLDQPNMSMETYDSRDCLLQEAQGNSKPKKKKRIDNYINNSDDSCIHISCASFLTVASLLCYGSI